MPEDWTVEPLQAYADAAIAHAAETSALMITAAEKLSSRRFDDQQLAVTAALAAQKEAVSAALTAADRAVAKAETAAERRFASVNEFRAQLADQAATFISRAEALLQISANTEKIDALSARMDRGEGGRAGSMETRTELRESHNTGVSHTVLAFMGVSILISVGALVASILLR